MEENRRPITHYYNGKQTKLTDSVYCIKHIQIHTNKQQNAFRFKIVERTITFRVQTPKDAGVYRCTAYARAGTVLSSDAVLQVGSTPFVGFVRRYFS